MPDRQGDTLDAMREETRAEGIDRDRRAPDAAGADDADRTAAGADDADRDAAVHELEAEFSALFVRARKAIAEAANAVSPGLQPGAYKVFTTIARRSGCTLSALADELGLDKGQLSRAVTELEGLGLVSRTPDPDDRRAQLLALTEHGSAQLSAAQTGRRRAMDASLSTWPVQDIRHLSRLLHALSGGLERHPAS